MRVLSVFNIKGGVGKTSSSINLAYLAARSGHRTVLWDLDPQAAATFTFRIRPRVSGGLRRVMLGKAPATSLLRASDYPRLDVAPAEFADHDLEAMHVDLSGQAVREVLEQLEGEYDVAILDCTPGMSALSEGVFEGSDALLCPTVPTTLSLRTLAQLMKYLKTRKGPRLPVMPFFSMVDRRKSLHNHVCSWVVEQKLGFLSAEIPYSSLMEQMAVRREPLFGFAASSPPARAFEQLWLEIEERSRETKTKSRLYKKSARRSIERVVREGAGAFDSARGTLRPARRQGPARLVQPPAVPFDEPVVRPEPDSSDEPPPEGRDERSRRHSDV